MWGISSISEDLPEFIEGVCPACFSKYDLAKDIIKILSENYPKNSNITESKIAEELDVTCRWIQKICAASFRITFTRLKRILRIYAALILMSETSLDILSIAVDLRYSDSTNLARDFKLELNFSPTETRLLLKKAKPDRVFKSLWSA